MLTVVGKARSGNRLSCRVHGSDFEVMLGLDCPFGTCSPEWLNAKLTASSQIFTLEINGKPTLVFEASDAEEARRICIDPDFGADLTSLTSAGIPICSRDATLTPRPAQQDEIAVFRRAIERAPAAEEPTMVFLVKIDGVVVVTVDPR